MGPRRLRAHKLTAEPRYLNRACAIFDDIVNRSWSDASCGGGCCWQAPHDADHMSGCYKNAITNELFLSLGAQLSNLYQQRCDAGTKAACDAAKRYHSWSLKELQWFLNSGMINASNLINDGLDTFGSHPKICADNGHTAYSYNQGVLLSGLGELYASKLHHRRADVPRFPRTALPPPLPRRRWKTTTTAMPFSGLRALLLRLYGARASFGTTVMGS